MASRRPTVEEVLAAVVACLNGEERPGQIRMAQAVASALQDRRHLLVQAGTGTGKSLGYLVPALLCGRRVVVATATLALQHQLVERDLPALMAAAAELLAEQPSYAVLKGRSNYACLHRIREGVPDDQGVLVDVPESTAGSEVVRLRAWAEQQAHERGPGDRDSAPLHTDRGWRQVSVSHRECLGATRCPYGAECFAERARERAFRASLVVTNHSLLAIDAIEGVPMIPDYDAVIIDEAHELVARVTQAETDELTVAVVERAARRAHAFVEGQLSDDLADAADALRAALLGCAPGRLETLPADLADALVLVRDTSRAVLGAFGKEAADAEPDAARQQARGFVDEVRAIADRLAAHGDDDVVWLTDSVRTGHQLCVAPLDVAGAIRRRLLASTTVIGTSATLKLGGDFTAFAGSVGLRAQERVALGRMLDDAGGSPDRQTDGDCAEDPGLPWQSLDVGSPFDYPRQAILYIARSLPAPGRDGVTSTQVDAIVALVQAAGGRTLGLFSSRRAAEVAAAEVRERAPDLRVLCQGEGQLSHLRADFVAEPAVSLFGTLSLWQGLDVPGETCQLVIIDRIPFPRPDDPLLSARAAAADRAGRNGFLSVSATHAALLLAQGAGRLIRTSADQGVVAVLDSRLATARYAGFLRASMPPMWVTYDGDVASAALTRLRPAAVR